MNSCYPVKSELTPIIFTHPTLRQQQDPFIPELIDQPIHLAPRYFIKIHGPNNEESAPIIYRIPHAGKWKNMVRLSLRPSRSRSSNSAYKVEYWEWNKIVYPKNYSPQGKRTSNLTYKDMPSNNRKLLFTEYWVVPVTTENKKVMMRRVDSDPEFPSCDFIYRDDVQIITDLIDEDGVRWFDYEIRDLSYRPYIESITKEVVTHMPAICWGQSHPRPNTNYHIDVVKPMSYKDIIYIPEWDMRSRDTESTLNNKHRYINNHLLHPFM